MHKSIKYSYQKMTNSQDISCKNVPE